MSKIYGIDLGMTGSFLGLGDRLLTGLVSSMVNLQTGEAGKGVLEDMSVTRSFECDISMSKEGQPPVSASPRVLRQLAKENGEDVQDVVISVPACFPDNQRHTIIKAAELADLAMMDLINEPAATTIYVFRSHRALPLVYDLGGGTSDVSVVDNCFGSCNVQTTDDCIPGDDNFDANIRRRAIKQGNIKVHHLNSEDLTRLKWDYSKLKTRLQKSRRDEVLDLTPYGAGQVVFTTEIHNEVMKLAFSRAITKAKKVLGEAVPVGEKYDLVIVSGSTRCLLLHEQVAEGMRQEPTEMFHDPDRIVTQDAALYTQMLSDDTAHIRVSDMIKALSIEMADGSARVLTPHDSKIPVQETTAVYNSVASNKLQLDPYQGDSLLISQNELIGQPTHSYDDVIPAGEGKIIMEITVEVDSTIRFSCRELLKTPVRVVLDRTKTSI